MDNRVWVIYGVKFNFYRFPYGKVPGDIWFDPFKKEWFE